MALLKRCTRCEVALLLRGKRYDKKTDSLYCPSCHEQLQQEREDARRARRAETRRRRMERRRRRQKEHDQQIREELRSATDKKRVVKPAAGANLHAHAPYRSHQRSPAPNAARRSSNPSKASREKHSGTPEPRPFSRYPDSSTIDAYDSLLYIEASVKRLRVIEWLQGKKRIAINKQREIRKTHAGGFSAEKFQRFVDEKKRRSLEWIMEQLQRPGVLREGYEKVIVEAHDEKLQKGIEEYVRSHVGQV